MTPTTAPALLTGFGLTLSRLSLTHLEQVRLWRNSHSVSQWLVQRTTISPEQQRAWFESLDPQRHHYYTIVHQDQPVGLVSLKNVDTQTGTGEGGIFIGEESLRNGTVAFKAILIMYDFGFETLKLREITAYILRTNPRAIRFNQALGFECDPGQEAMDAPLWRLSPQAYARKTATLRAYLGSDTCDTPAA